MTAPTLKERVERAVASVFNLDRKRSTGAI